MINFGSYLNDYLKYEGISQSDFAFRLGITQKHLNEIINAKTNISNELMWSIASFTGIDINFIAEIENRRSLEEKLIKDFGNKENLKEYLKSYKYNEVKKRNWIKFKDDSNVFQIAYDILKFLKYTSFDIVIKAKEKILFKENGNNIELLSLWLARCDRLAEQQEVNDYNKENLQIIIDKINNYCFKYKALDITEITKILNEHGIYFVVEDALSTTKARGAFKIFKNKPAIYLTRYYKRIDSMIFALYHELGHVKSDFNQGKSKVIIDGDPAQELRADEYALNAMISKKDYELNQKYAFNEPELKLISIDRKIPMCYIVSRLAKDNVIKYTDKLYLDNIIRIDC